MLLYYTFVLLLIYNLFKSSNGKVKLERLTVEVAAPSKVCFPLICIFFEVMLMSVIDGIRTYLESYYFYFF